MIHPHLKKHLKLAPHAIDLAQHSNAYIQLSAYSGVLTICKDKQLVLEYYD